jgi:hypothetical protein
MIFLGQHVIGFCRRAATQKLCENLEARQKKSKTTLELRELQFQADLNKT